MFDYDLEVDASGLNCPLPLLRLKKAIMEIEAGKIVKIIATDPAAHLDFGVYLNQSGHTPLKIIQQDQQQIFYIQKN